MTSRQITAPVALAVSMETAKLQLRVTSSDLDASIELWLKGITRECEHQIGRALVTQAWRTTLAAFDDAIQLERAPLIAVQSVSYYDAGNGLQVLAPDAYYVDAVTEPGYIVAAAGAPWPATFARGNAVTVEYTCGYGDTDDKVPENVKLYILARLCEQFDPATREFKATSQSMYVDRLLDACRVYS
ncbi:hypothetical protein F2P45_31750 [Massilia sp. CCM 8733]|uniref:PhiE125 gp8 family phage protein n=1 Tax=Massilia mucilaginosa TaxID=2609282 RepID=A0ABX0P383_9BURK|nr:phage head-tail connector protein [Massilia mucilaginosa]NHZ93542.1 hypothetical protein [Massilia mucilaginosa]